MADSTIKKQGLTSSFDLFGKSSALVQANLNIFAALYALPLLMTLSRFAGSDANKPGYGEGLGNSISGLSALTIVSLIGVGVILALVISVVNVILSIMMNVLELGLAQGHKPNLSDLWGVTKKMGLKMFGLQIAVSFVVAIGLLLLIVPGIIFIRRYFLAPYVMLDKDASIPEAMRMSAEMSKPYAGWIWGILGVSVLIALTGIIPLIGWIISFVLGVLYSVAPALRYQEIKNALKTPAPTPAAPEATPTPAT